MCEKVINFDRIGNANILNSEHYIHAVHVHLLKNYLENRIFFFQSNKTPEHSIRKIKRIKTHEIMLNEDLQPNLFAL